MDLVQYTPTKWPKYIQSNLDISKVWGLFLQVRIPEVQINLHFGFRTYKMGPINHDLIEKAFLLIKTIRLKQDFA